MKKCKMIGKIESCFKMSEHSTCCSSIGCIYDKDKAWNKIKMKRSEDTCCGHILTTEEKKTRSREAISFAKDNGLKTCPHCGRYPHGWHSGWVVCRCGASMSGNDAYKKWNKKISE